MQPSTQFTSTGQSSVSVVKQPKSLTQASGVLLSSARTQPLATTTSVGATGTPLTQGSPLKRIPRPKPPHFGQAVTRPFPSTSTGQVLVTSGQGTTAAQAQTSGITFGTLPLASATTGQQVGGGSLAGSPSVHTPFKLSSGTTGQGNGVTQAQPFTQIGGRAPSVALCGQQIGLGGGLSHFSQLSQQAPQVGIAITSASQTQPQGSITFNFSPPSAQQRGGFNLGTAVQPTVNQSSSSMSVSTSQGVGGGLFGQLQQADGGLFPGIRSALPSSGTCTTGQGNGMSQAQPQAQTRGRLQRGMPQSTVGLVGQQVGTGVGGLAPSFQQVSGLGLGCHAPPNLGTGSAMTSTTQSQPQRGIGLNFSSSSAQQRGGFNLGTAVQPTVNQSSSSMSVSTSQGVGGGLLGQLQQADGGLFSGIRSALPSSGTCTTGQGNGMSQAQPQAQTRGRLQRGMPQSTAGLVGQQVGTGVGGLAPSFQQVSGLGLGCHAPPNLGTGSAMTSTTQSQPQRGIGLNFSSSSAQQRGGFNFGAAVQPTASQSSSSVSMSTSDQGVGGGLVVGVSETVQPSNLATASATQRQSNILYIPRQPTAGNRTGRSNNAGQETATSSTESTEAPSSQSGADNHGFSCKPYYVCVCVCVHVLVYYYACAMLAPS